MPVFAGGTAAFNNQTKAVEMKMIKRTLAKMRGEQDIDKLVKRGLKVGENCNLRGSTIDPSHCFHITIGNNVTFGPRVHILAHDASTKIFLGHTRVANVKIGSNVFIGAFSVVLPGVTIGDNVVIGAGSIVTHDIPSDSVALGSPARVVKPLSEFLEERKKEMTGQNVFGKEFTLRNPDFGQDQREQLINACEQFGQIYVE